MPIEASIGDTVTILSTGIVIVALAGIAAIAYRLRRKPRSVDTAALAPIDGSRSEGDDGGAAGPPGYSSDAIDTAIGECFKLAFGVARFDYQIMGEHAEVLARVEEAAAASVYQREYFPRRPMLLPRLLQTLNDSESTRQELVRLILEDPSLAGSVLQRANSVFYRVSAERVESLDRAVVLLGTEGLRGLMATAILQPVFRLPKGYFDRFATVTWEQAQRAAVAAETYAKSTRSCDPFVAQLLGLLGALAHIVLFRLTMEKYRERPNVLPRAEVFIRTLQKHGTRVAALVASTWELSEVSRGALEEQSNRSSPAIMSPLGRAVYFGELCGSLALLAARGAYSTEGAQAMLIEQGLARETAHAIWHAAMSVGEEG